MRYDLTHSKNISILTLLVTKCRATGSIKYENQDQGEQDKQLSLITVFLSGLWRKKALSCGSLLDSNAFCLGGVVGRR